MILAAALGFASLTLAGCVSESSSYDGSYNSGPRDYSDRYGRDDRWRDRNDGSDRRDRQDRGDRWDRGNDEGRPERPDRDYRRGDNRRCENDPRCEVPAYNEERPRYDRRG